MDKALIQVHTSKDTTPIPLCCHFGEWSDETTLIGNWGVEPGHRALNVLGALKTRFPKANDHITSPGDPRNFCDDEMCRVAMDRNGQLGIWAEFELDFALGPEDTVDGPELADEICSPGLFERRVVFWQEKIASLVQVFPKTRFFLAHGEMTFMDHLTLNAFTPLTNGTVGQQRIATEDEFLMLSPYLDEQERPSLFGCETIRQITRALDEVGMNADLTGLEAAQAVGCARAIDATQALREDLRYALESCRRAISA